MIYTRSAGGRSGLRPVRKQIETALPSLQVLRVSVDSDQMRARAGDLETSAKREGPREGEGRAAKSHSFSPSLLPLRAKFCSKRMRDVWERGRKQP